MIHTRLVAQRLAFLIALLAQEIERVSKRCCKAG